MSTKPKSRWANTEEDAEQDAKLKLEKEEKRRKKAEKAQKLAEEEAARRKATAAQQADNTNLDHHDTDPSRPSKRRKLTPEPPSASSAPPKLLRFDPPSSSTLAPSRSVDHYDKLNDIEEGTYGFVARATELSTGRVVAIKRLKLEAADPNGLPVTGLREIQILKRCQHRNIVKLEEVVVGNDIGKPDK